MQLFTFALRVVAFERTARLRCICYGYAFTFTILRWLGYPHARILRTPLDYVLPHTHGYTARWTLRLVVTLLLLHSYSFRTFPDSPDFTPQLVNTRALHTVGAVTAVTRLRFPHLRAGCMARVPFPSYVLRFLPLPDMPLLVCLYLPVPRLQTRLPLPDLKLLHTPFADCLWLSVVADYTRSYLPFMRSADLPAYITLPLRGPRYRPPVPRVGCSSAGRAHVHTHLQIWLRFTPALNPFASYVTTPLVSCVNMPCSYPYRTRWFSYHTAHTPGCPHAVPTVVRWLRQHTRSYWLRYVVGYAFERSGYRGCSGLRFDRALRYVYRLPVYAHIGLRFPR